MGKEVQSCNLPFKLSPGYEIRVSVKWRSFWLLKRRINSHTHPSILVFLRGFPYRYIMALTPYPRSNAKYEHPSVVFSNDLVNWTEDRVSNPIVYHPYYYNADPHLTYDPINKRIIVYYMRLLGGSGPSRYNAVFAKFSYDAISWGEEVQVLPSTSPGELYVSPSVEYDEDSNEFLMWVVHVDLKTLEKKVLVYRSENGLRWEFIRESSIPILKYVGQSWDVWHLSVRKVGDVYWMIAAMNPSRSYNGDPPVHLFFLESRDGLDWKGCSRPILTSEEVGAEKLYRADFFVYNGVMHVIYSWMSHDYNWHISHTYINVGNTFLRSSNIIEKMLL